MRMETDMRGFQCRSHSHETRPRYSQNDILILGLKNQRDCELAQASPSPHFGSFPRRSCL